MAHDERPGCDYTLAGAKSHRRAASCSTSHAHACGVTCSAATPTMSTVAAYRYLCRAAGIQTIVLRLKPGSPVKPTNQMLHTTLFAIAAAIQETEIDLELRARDSLAPADPWPFPEDMWEPNDMQPGVNALAESLTVLQARFWQGVLGAATCFRPSLAVTRPEGFAVLLCRCTTNSASRWI